MISSQQIRAARAMLRMSVQDLSMLSGVGVATIKRLEAVDGLPPAHARTLESLRACLERAGIKFVGTIDNAPGVCLKNARSVNVQEGNTVAN